MVSDLDPKPAVVRFERLHLVPASNLQAEPLRLGQVSEVECVLAAEVAACVALADEPEGVALRAVQVLRRIPEWRSGLFFRWGKGHRERRIERIKAMAVGGAVEGTRLESVAAVMLGVLHRVQEGE